MKEIDCLSVFDLDGTLWKANSHLYVLNKFFETDFYTSFLAKIYSKCFSERWKRKIDKDFVGIPLSFLEEIDIDDFGINSDILNILKEKKKNSVVVIISNAPVTIVQKAGKRFGVTAIHAEIGKKSIVVNKMYKYKHLYVCTDNKTDNDLLQIADEKLFLG